MDTHYLSHGEKARGRAQTLCGIWIDWTQHASHPTCPTCKAKKEQDDADFLGTFGDPTEPLEPLHGGQMLPEPDRDPVQEFQHYYDRTFKGGRR